MKLVIILLQIGMIAMIDHAKELLIPIVLVLPFYLVAIVYVLKEMKKEEMECDDHD